MKAPGLGDVDRGEGIVEAALMAYELGLGTCCLGSPNTDVIRERLGLPESCRVLLLQTVGYPLESPEAGGQRLRQPIEKLISLNKAGEPFPRSPNVVAELERDGAFTEPAPLP